MNNSGSFPSADIDRHPLLKGVHPPAQQTDEGLLATGGAGWGGEGHEDPTGTNEATAERSRSFVESPDPTISMEVVSQDGDNDTTVRRPLWVHILLPILLVSFGTAVVISFQIWMADAHSQKHRGTFDNYTLVLFATFWPPVFFWAVTYVWELFVKRTCRFLPEVSLWLVILTAGLSGAWLLVVVFATAEERTPRDLQGVLAISLVIFTVILRRAVLKKGVGLVIGACLVTTVSALVVTTLPQVLGGGYTDIHREPTGASTASKVVWSIVYTLGFALLASSLVLFEHIIKRRNQMPASLLAYLTTFQFLTILGFFWLDFIPVVGLADSLQEFWRRMERTVLCSFDQDSCSSNLAYTWIFTSFLTAFVWILLGFMHFLGGSLHAVITACEAAPLVAVFWSLFVYPEVPLRWQPEVATYTWIALVGFAMMLPPMAVYGHKIRRRGGGDL